MFINVLMLLLGFSLTVGMFGLITDILEDIKIASILLFFWSTGLGAFLMAFYKIMTGG